MSKEAADELLGVMESTGEPFDVVVFRADLEIVAERKIEALASMKQSIKKESIEPLFQSLRLGLTNSNSQISSQTLTAAHGALRRLNLQDQGLLRTALPTILTQLIDRMGDTNDKVADLAVDCLAVAWRAASIEVEGSIKQLGFAHKVSRVREHSIRWLAKMATDGSIKFAFRSFTSYLITSLEDADGSVRDAGKHTIVDLYLTVPQHARADLRREMSMQNVRKSTIQFILAKLEIADGPELNLSKSTASQAEEPATRTTKRLVTPGSHAEGSIAGSMASTYLGSLPGSEMDSLDAAFVHSSRDLEHELVDMLACFEGRESERNWMAREKSLNRIRSLLRGNANKDHHTVFMAGIKALLEGIIKGMTSLRTSLCLIGLQLAKDLCITLGPGADPFVEQLLVALIKLCGATKKIQAQAANITTSVLIAHVSYHSRLLQHLSLAVQDKNVTPRLFTTNWLKVFLEAHADAKAQIEHSGIDLLDRSIRKGLSDANPGVREGMRATYWSYAVIWPDKASSIINSLDPTAKKQLEKADPSAAQNPVNSATNGRSAHTRGGSTSRPPIKTLVQNERSKMAQQSSIDTTTASRPIPKEPQLSDSRNAEPKSSGLSSGPLRHGLGGAVRPGALAARKPSNTAKTEEPLRSSVRSVSSNQGVVSTQSSSPLKAEAIFSPKRRRPIIEQLESENWRVRVDGVITLACLLANKQPPDTDGQKITLPSSETLAPILRKLMADSQAEVVDHLMAPEVIAEVAKIIEWDCILPRVLLMAETDDSEHGHDVKSNCLPAVKAMFEDNIAVQQCLDILALLKVSGHLVKPVKANFRFNPAQKRPIIKAVLEWLTELIERHQQAVDRGESGNSAFSELAEYKLVMSRTTLMMTNIQPSSMNYSPLATFLKALRRSDETTFDKNLSTFEKPVIVALKKAWGEKPLEDDEALEEPVADVESVLGAMPVILPTESTSPSRSLSPVSSTGALSQTNTPDRKADVEIYSSPNNNEDLTMIPSMFVPKTPAGFREALPMVDSPWTNKGLGATPSIKQTSVNGKENKATGDPGGLTNTATAKHVNGRSGARKLSGTDLWYRRKMKENASDTPLPKILEDKKKLLDTYVERLRRKSLDAHGFRKLIKMTKDNATDEADDEAGKSDIWEAGSRFDALMSALLEVLSSTEEVTAEMKMQGTLLLRVLLRCQAHYFGGHESHALVTLLSLRSMTDSRSLVAGIDELVPELVAELEPQSGTTTVLQYLTSYVVEDNETWKSEKMPSLQMALVSLSLLVSQLSVEALAGFAQALAQVIVKTLNDDFAAPDIEVAEVRRNTVNLCMAMHSVIGDTRTVLALLKDLKASHQNLLTYYFAKEREDPQYIGTTAEASLLE